MDATRSTTSVLIVEISMRRNATRARNTFVIPVLCECLTIYVEILPTIFLVCYYLELHKSINANRFFSCSLSQYEFFSLLLNNFVSGVVVLTLLAVLLSPDDRERWVYIGFNIMYVMAVIFFEKNATGSVRNGPTISIVPYHLLSLSAPLPRYLPISLSLPPSLSLSLSPSPFFLSLFQKEAILILELNIMDTCRL